MIENIPSLLPARQAILAAVIAWESPGAIVVQAGNARQVAIESTSAAHPVSRELAMICPETLISAKFDRPSTISLEFEGGVKYSLELDRLGMPLGLINWPTLKAAPSGNKVTVKRVKGGVVPIDSATLRYLVDEKYAAKIDKSIEDLHMSPAEASEAARISKLTRDPRWNDVRDEDDLFE